MPEVVVESADIERKMVLSFTELIGISLVKYLVILFNLYAKELTLLKKKMRMTIKAIRLKITSMRLLIFLSVIVVIIIILTLWIRSEVFFPNQVKMVTIRLSEYEKNSDMYLVIENKNGKNVIQFDVLKTSREKIYPTNSSDYYTSAYSDNEGPQEGYLIFFNKERLDDEMILRFKNKTNSLKFIDVSLWLLHGDRWTRRPLY